MHNDDLLRLPALFDLLDKLSSYNQYKTGESHCYTYYDDTPKPHFIFRYVRDSKGNEIEAEQEVFRAATIDICCGWARRKLASLQKAADYYTL